MATPPPEALAGLTWKNKGAFPCAELTHVLGQHPACAGNLLVTAPLAGPGRPLETHRTEAARPLAATAQALGWLAMGLEEDMAEELRTGVA